MTSPQARFCATQAAESVIPTLSSSTNPRVTSLLNIAAIGQGLQHDPTNHINSSKVIFLSDRYVPSRVVAESSGFEQGR